MTHPQRIIPLLSLLAGALLMPCHAQDEATPWSPRADIVEARSERADGFNYDESNVPDYTLPDPLVTQDGSQVRDAETWNSTRRDQLMDLFRDHVYGHRPAVDADISFATTEEIKDAFDGAATGRSLLATIRLGQRTHTFPVTLFIPNHSDRPAPAIVHINNRYFTPLEKALAENDPFWPAETLIQRGYATATFHTSDVDPDNKDAYLDGIRAFFANGEAPTPTAWRSLSAWGWGASRILDHLATRKEIDPARVAVVGHSRGGKAALWAAAEDTRFAIAYSNNSGCGGAALSRRAYGETVARITQVFPHWFCEPFAAYSGRESELPVDQHQLIALIAPRGVYIASADEDLWADPRGEYASLTAAAPVFQLLGKTAITTPEMPPLNTPRVTGQTGYHIRAGGHGLTEVDWTHFLNFADTLLK